MKGKTDIGMPLAVYRMAFFDWAANQLSSWLNGLWVGLGCRHVWVVLVANVL